jgi:hypothetical protein
MKFTIKVLLLLSILCLSEISTKSHHKKNSHSKSKTKSDSKIDSWDTGFTCPKIRVKRLYAGEKSEAQVIEDIRIMGPHILSPRDDIDRAGIALEFRPTNKPFGFFADLLVKHPNPAYENTYILPYRKIYKDFYFTRRGMKKIWIFGGGRHIVFIGYARGQDLRDSGLPYRYRIKITLPYEGNHTKVSDSEISKILYGINNNRIEIFERLNDNKLGMMRALNAYKRDRGILEEYVKGNGDFQALRLKFKDKLLQLTTRFYTRAIASAMFLAQMITLKEERGKLSAQIFQMSNKVSTETKQIEDIALEMESIGGAAENSVKMQTEYNERKDNSRKILIKLLKDITDLDSDVSSYSNPLIENIKNNPMFAVDKNEFTNKMTSIIPC